MPTSAPVPPFRLPLIAILRGIAPEEVAAHAAALVEEGCDAIEIPTNSPQWERSVAVAVHAHGEQASIGAGTVRDGTQLDRLCACGGTLAVMPDARPALIADALARGLQVLPGIATPAEAFHALDAGARMLKLFPASVYGPAMVRALRSVLPPVPLFAVGGVTPEAMSGYLSAGCDGFGIGGELYRAGQSAQVTRERARRFIQTYRDHAG